MRRNKSAGASITWLPETLTVYDSAIDVGEVPVPNTSSARRVITHDGKLWVRKGEVYDPNSTVGEAVSWQLAKVLDVPTPQGAILRDGETLVWMSENVKGAQHWSPNHIEELHDPYQIGRIVALDVLICNSDRHVRNLLAEYRKDGKLSVWAIDHGAMDCVHGARWESDAFLQIPLLPKAADHIFTGIPSGYFNHACRKAAAAFSQGGNTVIDLAVETAYKNCGKEAPAEVVDLIGYRLANMAEMMDAYLESAGQ